jgi:hypothetical protein
MYCLVATCLFSHHKPVEGEEFWLEAGKDLVDASFSARPQEVPPAQER